MKKLLLCFALLALFVPASFACLNETSVTADGDEVFSDAGLPTLVPKGTNFAASKANYEKQLTRYYDYWIEHNSISSYSDYGVNLVYLGRYEEAKKVFQEIEKLSPGLYATAANIGTVYELLGQNDSALYWITESVRIAPSAHDSSEWLHVNILKAKIKGEQYYTSEFLIGTSFGNDAAPATKLTDEQLDKLGMAIYYQLKERMSFIKPKEPIVALLLFELGNITSYTHSVANAIDNYRLAKEYGYDDLVMNARWQRFASKHNEQVDVTDPHQKVDPPHDTTGAMGATLSTKNSDAWIIFGLLSLVIGLALVRYFKRTAK